MELQTLDAEHRTAIGTRLCRALREQARIPGIIYGHKQDPVPISLDRHALNMELQHRHRLLSVRIGNAEEALLIRDVQYDHLGIEPVHIDLLRVDLNETLQVEVGIELLGTPRGTSGGGVLDHILTSTTVECLASDIPSRLSAVISNLEIGDTLTLAGVDLPTGVKLIESLTTIVATVRVLGEEIETLEDEESQGNEPEVISRGKAEEEDS